MAGFSISTFALLKKMIADSLKGAGAIKGQKGDKGDAGTIAINSVKTLPTGSEATVENVGTASSAKLNIGIPEGQQGKTGPKGSTGATGQSAYEAAKANGYTGTVTEWLESLHGKDGAAGKAGEDGEAGPAGKSAYEIAKEQGYTGTEAEWIGSLKGKQGDKGETGKDGADGKSFTIQAQYATEAELKAAHPTGNAGDAYYVGENTASSRPDVYIWLAESNEWYNQGPISGVKGDDGASGKSAYELAEENGYSGSESEWLASLKGAKGDKGEKGDQGPQGEQGIQGLQGPQGIAGAKGDKGDTGATGEKGDKGEKGDAATIKVGKVVSGEAGTEAVVANSGTTSDAVFDFTIPRGDKGDKGDTGDNGVIRTTDYNLKDSVAGDIAIRNWTKNLLPYPYAQTTLTSNGVTFTDSKDGRITASGTATDNVFFNFIHMSAALVLKAGTTYTLSGVKGVFVSIRSYASDGTTEQEHFDIESGVGSLTFTPTVDSAYITIYIYVASGATVSAIVRPMLEIGDVAHGYVPFAGYNIYATGKNLFAQPYYASDGLTAGGLTFTLDEDGSVIINGTMTSTKTLYFGLYQFDRPTTIDSCYLFGKKLTLSYQQPEENYTSIFVNWGKMSDNKKTVNNEYAVRDKSGSVTFEWDDTDDFFGLQAGIYVSPRANGKTFNDYKIKFQLEVGDKVTEFAPHFQIQSVKVTNEMEGPVFGLKAYDGITNILTDGRVDAEVDYPKTIGGAYSLNAFNKLETAELMQKPNKWESGKEYDFGDGVYGKRLTGTLTVAKNVVSTDKIIFYSGGLVNVISYGGWMDIGDGSRYTVPSTDIDDLSKMGNIYLLYTYVTKQLQLRSLSMVDRTNAPYDVWVLYTKA